MSIVNYWELLQNIEETDVSEQDQKVIDEVMTNISNSPSHIQQAFVTFPAIYYLMKYMNNQQVNIITLFALNYYLPIMKKYGLFLPDLLDTHFLEKFMIAEYGYNSRIKQAIKRYMETYGDFIRKYYALPKAMLAGFRRKRRSRSRSRRRSRSRSRR